MILHQLILERALMIHDVPMETPIIGHTPNVINLSNVMVVLDIYLIVLLDCNLIQRLNGALIPQTLIVAMGARRLHHLQQNQTGPQIHCALGQILTDTCSHTAETAIISGNVGMERKL